MDESGDGPVVVIEVAGLTRRFGSFTAVDGIDMRIRRGSVHGFLGPNGSGKTTAIRMMCGLMEPSAGTVQVLGHSLPRGVEEVRRRVGYMTQRFSLYEDLSIAENLTFLCRIHGFGRRARRERIGEVVEQFRLEDLIDMRVGPMSGGQKRRIALAAAVLTDPELLILDEPTSEVDPNTRGEMWEHFFQLAHQGKTLLLSTHLMDEAERCHHLTVMNRGRVVADGTVADLKDSFEPKVLRVEGRDVTALVPRIAAFDGVLQINQVATRLRVLVAAGASGVEQQIRGLGDAVTAVDEVEPSIEDVFVLNTRQEARAE